MSASMKRLTYISKSTKPLGSEEVQQIEKKSIENNSRDGITGVLLSLRGIFFQIIEGDNDKIEALWERLTLDERHTEVLCLKLEPNITERAFPQWSMRTINLESLEDYSEILRPIKTLLSAVTESHRVLEKYTQQSVFKLIHAGLNPLVVTPQRRERVVMFCDILAFTSFAERLSVEAVVACVNTYFTICTAAVQRHGGEVTKFIGDSVLAYFNADQAPAAIQASLEILQNLRFLRASEPEHSPLRVLFSGIGLHTGEVIEGTIGSSFKKDYTILGDTVNVASRIEASTRASKYLLAYSADVQQQLTRLGCSSPHERELGAFVPRGKRKGTVLYTIDNEDTRKPLGAADLNEHILEFMAQHGSASDEFDFGSNSSNDLIEAVESPRSNSA